MQLTNKIQIHNIDCMELMARYDDKYFDLAIVDPPYGIKEDGKSNHSRGGLVEPTKYKSKEWDSGSPSPEYFKELMRVSKDQIIFGANHFISKIPFDSSCWIVWNKMNGDTDFADCELAWTSFKTAVRKVNFKWNGMLQGDMKNKEKRIHPTQKPVKVYEWILRRYCKPGSKVIDTHSGSASLAIAANYYDLSEFVACEIDVDYFNDSVKRFKNQTKQLRFFN